MIWSDEQVQCSLKFSSLTDLYVELDIQISDIKNATLIHNLYKTPEEFKIINSRLTLHKIQRSEAELCRWLNSMEMDLTRLIELLLKDLINIQNINIDIKKLLPSPELMKVDPEKIKTVTWLCRPIVRLYPNAEKMERLVFSARWKSLHFADLLSCPLPESTPVRDLAILKRLRGTPEKITSIEVCGFYLIKFTKNQPDLLDAPRGVSIWLSSAEIYAYITTNPNIKFQVEDALLFKVDTSKSQQRKEILKGYELLMLSKSFGESLQNTINNEEINWFQAWVKSVERSRWITLVGDLNSEFNIIASGYGLGLITFYCLEHQLKDICEMMKKNAAVIKQSDKPFSPPVMIDESDHTNIDFLNEKSQVINTDENCNI